MKLVHSFEVTLRFLYLFLVSHVGTHNLTPSTVTSLDTIKATADRLTSVTRTLPPGSDFSSCHRATSVLLMCAPLYTIWAVINALCIISEPFIEESTLPRIPGRPITQNTMPVFTSVAKVSTCTGTRHHCTLTGIRCRWTCLTITHWLDTNRTRSRLRIGITTSTVTPCRPAGHLTVSICTFCPIEVLFTRAMALWITTCREWTIGVAIARCTFSWREYRTCVCNNNITLRQSTYTILLYTKGMALLYFICNGFVALWATGSKGDIWNENIFRRRKSNQWPLAFQPIA